MLLFHFHQEALQFLFASFITTEHWVEFPVLCSRFSLVIYLIRSISSVYNINPNLPVPLTPYPLGIHTSLCLGLYFCFANRFIFVCFLRERGIKQAMDTWSRVWIDWQLFSENDFNFEDHIVSVTNTRIFLSLCRSSDGQPMSKQVQLFSNKPFFSKTGRGAIVVWQPLVQRHERFCVSLTSDWGESWLVTHLSWTDWQSWDTLGAFLCCCTWLSKDFKKWFCANSVSHCLSPAEWRISDSWRYCESPADPLAG